MPILEEEGGHKVSLLAEKLLAIEGPWDREIQFSSWMNPQESTCAPVQVLCPNMYWERWVDLLGKNNNN